MYIIDAENLSDEQKEEILLLWNKEYPVQLGYKDMAAFDSYLDGLTEKKHYLVISAIGTVVGWAMTFTRDGERWFAMILDRSQHRKGLGTQMLNKLKEAEPVLHGWVTYHHHYVRQDGTPYPTPLGFYLRNGFFDMGERLNTEQLSAVKIRCRRE